MRISLLTLAMLVAMNSDLQVLLWALALLPAAGALMFVGFLLKPAARRVQRDDRAWRGVHRTRQAPGRHSPARGKRLQGLSRQAQLEERTVSVDAAALGLDREALRRDRDALIGDVARIYGVPRKLLEPPADDPLKETTEAWQAPEPHVHEPYRDGVRLRCRTCKLDLPEPEGMPEIGPHGFSSWS
jgi:hypothetical protein